MFAAAVVSHAFRQDLRLRDTHRHAQVEGVTAAQPFLRVRRTCIGALDCARLARASPNAPYLWGPCGGAALIVAVGGLIACLLYTSPSPRDYAASRMPSSA